MMKCPITGNECEVIPKLVITRAIRFLGTNKVMVDGPSNIMLRFLQGKPYWDTRNLILELSNTETRFYYHIPHEDPNQPVTKVEVSKNEW